MKFRTEIQPLKGLQGSICHNSKIWTIGSCFADNVGDRMLAQGFDVEVNPLGTLYNPLSILRSVSAVIEGKVYTPDEFFQHEGKWRNYDFHSIFAKSTPEASATMVNSTLDRLRAQLPELSVMILTLGSARCFRRVDTGAVVANCHKQNPALFRVDDITPEICFEAISETISLLQRAAPKLHTVILTVSPIRHIGYGLHADRLSKSALLLAADRAAHTSDSISYFPSYEIMIDDLRDYRFYAADMVHPSEVAVDYIYDLFSRTYYYEATLTEAASRLREFRRSCHIPR